MSVLDALLFFMMLLPGLRVLYLIFYEDSVIIKHGIEIVRLTSLMLLSIILYLVIY